jgi:hypothetical protein
MSDTSGSGGFGASGRKIRRQIQIVFGPPERKPERGSTAVQVKFGGTGAPEKKRTKQAKPAGGDGAAVLPGVLWQPLADDDNLERVALPPELLYYLKAMARFIYGAKRGGMAAVMDEFELRAESKFPSLRRYISSHAPGNSDSDDEGSEQHSRAGGAFNAGSARWAQEFSGIADPTQIAVSLLVDQIRTKDRYEEALLLSPRRIIQEYGERLIRGLMRADDPWRDQATPALIKEFHRQLDKFFAEHSAATEWEPQRIEKTLDEFPGFLLD